MYSKGEMVQTGLPSLLTSRMILVFLFVTFRVMALFAHQPYLTTTPEAASYDLLEPDGSNIREQGLTSTGDFWYYYGLARWSDQGLLPYRDYWYEFPPVFPTLSLTIYSLISDRDQSYSSYNVYANLLAMVMILVDALNLLLLRRLGTRLHGPMTGIALSWMYALIPISFLHVFWNFEPLVAFTVLLSLTGFVEGRDMRGALGAALGACTKLFPLILLAPVWRMRTPAQAIRTSVIAVGITAVAFIGMIALNREFGMGSLMVQFNKASYQTIWAVIDGNQATGLLDPDHRDPAAAYQLQGNPSVVPWWLRGIVFGGIGLWVYVRTRRRDEMGFVLFTTITVVIFFLWSQGWSPQWQVTLFPLILLCMPNGRGVLFCVTLGIVGLAEFPLLFSYGIDRSTGMFSPQTFPLWVALVSLRTLMLAGLAFELYRRLRISTPRKPVSEVA